MKRFALLLTLLLLLGTTHRAFVPVASAHAIPVGCVPRAGITLDAPPPTVLCIFSTPLVIEKSSLEVVDAQGKRVDKGDVKTYQGDVVSMVVSLDTAKMSAGIYTIRWTANDPLDDSTTNGTLEFGINTVVPPTPTPKLPGFVMTPQPLQTASTANGVTPTELISRFLIAAGVILLGAMGFLFWRVRRAPIMDDEADSQAAPQDRE